jgi:acyl carrier protein
VSVETRVRSFLRDELGKDVGQIGDHESLLESGTIDSIGVMQLVAFLETSFGITVEDDELTPENFDTIAAVSSFIARRQAGARD